MEYLIGIDMGTSAIKGVLMTSGGQIVSKEKAQTQYEFLEGGWIQSDAEQLYRLTADLICRLTASLPEGTAINGISLSSASGNTLLIDNQGKPMTPIFSWMDTRVDNELEMVFGRLVESEVHEIVGWPLINTFPLAHLSWLKCHQPELLESSARICMSADYINYKLTGEWGIDSSTATTFYLQNQKSARYHLPYLQKLDIPMSKLPTIHPSGTIIGKITPAAAANAGLLIGTSVVLGSFDHPSAARGAGVLDEGQLLLSCGTSWVGFYPVKDREKAIQQKLLVDPFLQPEGAWGAMFSLPAIATSIEDYINQYISSADDRYEMFDKLAAAAKPGSDGLMLNPILEGSIENLTGYDKSAIARALMESAAYLLKMQMDRLALEGLSASSVTMVGGPSETFPWPQIVADVLGLEISTVNGACAGATGAAIMAGVGLGIYKDARDALSITSFKPMIRQPDPIAHEVYKDLYLKFKSKFNLPGGDSN